jgi:oxygen-dependent protoporphyrinogen oxidase
MRIAVIGGGISGIASAHFLRLRHAEVDLFESESNIGGRIGNERLLDKYVDIGGKNVGKHYHHFRSFAEAYGCPKYEYFGINTSQLVNGTIIGLSRDGRKLSNLLNVLYLSGARGLLKLYPQIRTILKNREEGALCSDLSRKISDRSDHLSIADYLPRRCVNHIVRPMTVRMNGAEPDECYPGNFGSNLAVALDSFEQLTPGMHRVIESFRNTTGKDSLNILENHHIVSISQRGRNRQIEIEYTHDGKTGYASYDKVISALPAPYLAGILEHHYPTAASLLRQIRYFPVAIAIVRYQHEVFTKARRAMIFDSSSPLSNLGAYGVNDLNIARFTFSGRTARQLVSAKSSPEDIILLGEKTASSYFELKNNTRLAHVYRYLPEGLCAYSHRHHLLLERIDHELSQITGFAATGDYRRGASIEACCRAARECVDTTIGVTI